MCIMTCSSVLGLTCNHYVVLTRIIREHGKLVCSCIHGVDGVYTKPTPVPHHSHHHPHKPTTAHTLSISPSNPNTTLPPSPSTLIHPQLAKGETPKTPSHPYPNLYATKPTTPVTQRHTITPPTTTTFPPNSYHHNIQHPLNNFQPPHKITHHINPHHQPPTHHYTPIP